jgi:hypothetical protein
MSSDELRTLVSGMNYVPKALIFGSCAPRKDDKEHLPRSGRFAAVPLR